MSKRIDYNAVAKDYDRQPYRGKEVDPHLSKFVAFRNTQELQIADLACGTGNQLIANHQHYPNIKMTGCDLSVGMLNVARAKNEQIVWIEGSLDSLPLNNESFDFVTCQFAFHHVLNKQKAVEEIYRVTKWNGRFVLENISPHHMKNNFFYQLFPRSLEQDLVDFMEPKELCGQLERVGFNDPKLIIKNQEVESTLQTFYNKVVDKQSNSELALLTQQEYEEGLTMLQEQIQRLGSDYIVKDHVALVTIITDKLK